MKKIIISLIVGFVGIISFSDAGILTRSSVSIGPGNQQTFNSGYCVTASSVASMRFYDGNNNNYSTLSNSTEYYCFENNGYVQSTDSSTRTLYYFNLNDYLSCNCPICEEQYTSEQCQTEYNLIPIENVDSEYCELNNLCEVIGGSGSSTLYINDIRHESAPFIYVNIPEEIQRDYNTGVNEFTINVQGLNGDQDYINGIIDVNSYRPTSEDFTQTFVGGLTLFFPYIIITAVILFIWRFIRKIFK